MTKPQTKSSSTVQVGRKGAITLPKALRDKYGFNEGDAFTVIDLGDGKLLLAPGVSEVARLSGELENMLTEEGVDLEEMLRVLEEEREAYYREHYLNSKDLPG